MGNSCSLLISRLQGLLFRCRHNLHNLTLHYQDDLCIGIHKDTNLFRLVLHIPQHAEKTVILRLNTENHTGNRWFVPDDVVKNNSYYLCMFLRTYF